MAQPTAQATAATAALKQTIDSAVRESNKDQTNTILQNIHEVMVELMGLKTQLNSLSEALNKSNAKSVNRAPKTTDVAKDTADGSPKPDATNAALAAAFASKPAYFKYMYKSSPEFRQEYKNQFIADAITADTTIAKKKTEADKLVAESNVVWNTIRTQAQAGNADMIAMQTKYNASFEDSKKNFTAAQKAAPLTADDAPTTQ